MAPFTSAFIKDRLQNPAMSGWTAAMMLRWSVVHPAGQGVQSRPGQIARELQGYRRSGIRGSISTSRAGPVRRLQPDQCRAAGSPASDDREDEQNGRAHHSGPAAAAGNRGEHAFSLLQAVHPVSRTCKCYTCTLVPNALQKRG